MEKEKLACKSTTGAWLARLLHALILALPILGMLLTSSKVLAEVELGDPVELFKTHLLPMTFVKWSLITALVMAFTPFKRVCALAAGLAVGSLGFHALDLYQQLSELSKMGLSEQPLTEMVVLSADGKWMIRWTALTLLTQVICGLAFPVLKAWKKYRETSQTKTA